MAQCWCYHCHSLHYFRFSFTQPAFPELIQVRFGPHGESLGAAAAVFYKSVAFPVVWSTASNRWSKEALYTCAPSTVVCTVCTDNYQQNRPACELTAGGTQFHILSHYLRIHLCQVAGNTVWSHMAYMMPRISEMGTQNELYAPLNFLTILQPNVSMFL